MIKTSKRSIVKKIIIQTMLFSTLITMPFIFINFYYEYRNEIANIEKAFGQFEKSGTSSLSFAVWYLDRNQIDQQLKGLIKNVPFAQIDFDASIIGKIQVKSTLVPNGPSKTFNIYHDQKNIGSIKITSSIDPLVKALIFRFVLIFFSVILNTFLVAYYTILILKKNIITPLENINKSVQKMSLDQSILLNSMNTNNNDQNELEAVNNSINQMQNNFYQSYVDLLSTKERLNDILIFSSKGIFETNDRFEFNFSSEDNANTETNNLNFIKMGNLITNLPITDQQKIDLISKKEKHDFTILSEGNIYNIYVKSILKNNKFAGYRGIVFDITEKVNGELKIKNQNEQIQQMQKTGTIGELTASLAHDFRNYLTIIIYSNEILLKNELEENSNFSKAKTISYLKNSLEASEKADVMISKLLNFSRRHTSLPEVVNLFRQSISIKEILEVAITKRNTLEIVKLNEIKECEVDINLFENVLLNLCVNAKDAIKNNGKIEIIFSQVKIENHFKMIDGEYVLIKVSDNGVGMAPNTLNKIFEPFFTTKEAGKGTGLGLSMVFNFINNSKGHIDVQSLEGVGTSFYLYFPIVKDLVQEIPS